MSQYAIVDEKTPVPPDTPMGRAKAHFAKRLDNYGRLHQSSAKQAGAKGKKRVLSVYDQMPSQQENP